METKELTTRHRIEILEDVLKKLENFDINGGLCLKIENSAFELFRILDKAKNIIPIFTFENAGKVTELEERAHKEFYWWAYVNHYDLLNRIKFVNWMINEEKSL